MSFATDFPLGRRRLTLREISTRIEQANHAVGNRANDIPSFENGYWQGVHDERMSRLTSPRKESNRVTS